MSKCALIIPYFGKFPNYFQMFLNSCAHNKNFDFFIFSDDEFSYEYPTNVKFYKTTFAQFKNKLSRLIDDRVVLDHPKKLCDFKPVYGYLFQEYLSGYLYWGHCDVDVILGDLDDLVFPLIESGCYDKIFNLGHLTIYRNSKEVREMFFKEIKVKASGSVFFRNQMCKFDEENGDSIVKYFLEGNYNIYKKQLEADISTKYSRLFLDKYDFESNSYVTKKEDYLFVYYQGKVLCYSIVERNLVCEEYAYIHLQKRNMDVFISDDENKYVIAANRFYPLDFNLDELNEKEFKKIRKYFLNLHAIKIRYKNFLIKLNKFFT